MVYGDDGNNNGENNGGGSLILLCSLRGYIPSLLLKLYEEKEMLFFFLSLRWVSCTSNSNVGHLSIFTSRLTFSILLRFRALAPFYFLVFIIFFLLLFFSEHSSLEII